MQDVEKFPRSQRYRHGLWDLGTTRGMTIYCHWYSHLVSICSHHRGVWPLVIQFLVVSLPVHHHSSSRIDSCDDSTSLAPMFCDSAGVWTNPTLASSFTSAAATLACMRPSCASLRVKRAISESYSSHSGICRARESFGSFCICDSTACQS
jgi:hypothetical protein